MDFSFTFWGAQAQPHLLKMLPLCYKYRVASAIFFLFDSALTSQVCHPGTSWGNHIVASGEDTSQVGSVLRVLPKNASNPQNARPQNLSYTLSSGYWSRTTWPRTLKNFWWNNFHVSWRLKGQAKKCHLSHLSFVFSAIILPLTSSSNSLPQLPLSTTSHLF